MNHAKTSFSTEICAGAIISVVQYLATLRYSTRCSGAAFGLLGLDDSKDNKSTLKNALLHWLAQQQPEQRTR
jgi:hypothetical protein